MKSTFHPKVTTGAALLIAVLLLGCHSSKKNIQYPLTASYEVSASDSSALDLVETYYATDFHYTAYDTARFFSTRNLRDGAVMSWIDEQGLYIRETKGRFCSCTDITGDLFQVWKDGFDSPELLRAASSYKMEGRRVFDARFVREEGDTTWLTIDEETPNLWFDFPWMPGLPVDYSYRLRGGEVHYKLVSSDFKAPTSYDPERFSDDCVRIPPEAWLGEGPQSELAQSSNRIWVYGYMIDEDENLLTGELGVASDRNGRKGFAATEVAQGSFDVELLRGEVYTLDFKAENSVKKKLVLDCSNVPDTDTGYLIEINVELFEEGVEEVQRYLDSNPMMRIYYDTDSANFVVDYALAQQAALDLELMRQRSGGRGAE